jgi:ATP-binding cassette subfamily B protein
MLLGLIIKSFATIVELVIPSILSHIIDEVVPAQNLSMIILWGVLMIVCSAAALIGNVSANRMAARTARNCTHAIRYDLFEKTMRLSCRACDEMTIPSLESRLTSDTYNLHHLIGAMQRIGVRAPLLLIGGILITMILDYRLSLVMVATLPFLSALVVFVSKKGIPLYSSVQKKVDVMTRVVRENAQGVRVIKALSKKEYEKKHFDDANRDLVRTEKRVSFIMSSTNPTMQMLLNIGLVGVVLVGAYLVNADITKPGKIIAFLQYFTLISNSMMVMTRIFMMYSKGVASANRISEVLETECEVNVCSKLDYPNKKNGSHIEFKDVSFGYNANKSVLKNISFKLLRGQTLGIIGATGSGKSTLVHLLLRFYDVDEGDIYINGENLRTLNEDALHEIFGIALQSDFIYSGTIRDNIDFERELSDEQISLATERAQAKEFIDALDSGFLYEVSSKGTNVSGGQRQRLLISRALAADPEILILDDSSSALDYKTDLLLRRAISDIDSDMTTIIVAQRISSVKDADLIIVLDEGEIADMGTHEHLLSSCDIYREISESQMGGAFVE